jgi:hypothetical protein
MYYVKRKNLISLVERATHNRFCDRNLLKTGRTFFSKKESARRSMPKYRASPCRRPRFSDFSLRLRPSIRLPKKLVPVLVLYSPLGQKTRNP